MEPLLLLTVPVALVIITLARRYRFNHTAPLRERIDPNSTALYDEVVYRFYPDSTVRDEYPLPGMRERALRKEDEEKFRCFIGQIAQNTGFTRFQPNLLNGWPDHLIIQATSSTVINEHAWATIRDCPPQFHHPVVLNHNTKLKRRSEI